MSDLAVDRDPVRAPKEPPKIKNWGRIWRVTVKRWLPVDLGLLQTYALPGYAEVLTFEQNDWSPEGLHITFDAEMTFYQSYWVCDVSIYNLNDPTLSSIIEYGMVCVVEAGYQSTGLGTVFEGTIFQPMWEKENGTDSKLTLHCIVGALEDCNNFIGHTVEGGITQRDLVTQMMANAKYPIQVNMGEPPEGKPKLTRATTYFDQPNDLLQYVADDNEFVFWFSHLKANLFRIDDDTTPEWEYGIDNGLVGTPQQTQRGVTMRVLLNPYINLLDQVKLKQNVFIKQLARTIRNYATIITQDYRYIVASIRHTGDTRGNEWYTEITAYFNPDQLIMGF